MGTKLDMYVLPVKMTGTDFTKHAREAQCTKANPLSALWELCSETLWTTLGETFTGNSIAVWFRSSNSAYHLLGGGFNIFKCMLTLQHRDQGITVSQTKMAWRLWGDLNIVWLDMDGWISTQALMSFQLTPCMLLSGLLQIQLTL